MNDSVGRLAGLTNFALDTYDLYAPRSTDWAAGAGSTSAIWRTSSSACRVQQQQQQQQRGVSCCQRRDYTNMFAFPTLTTITSPLIIMSLLPANPPNPKP